MKLWQSLFKFGKRDADISLDQWQQYFTYNGTMYPVGSSVTPLGGYGGGGKYSERIENDFIGYVNGAYKASGVIFACCMARSMIFSEIRFAYQALGAHRPGEVTDGPGLEVLDTPWPNGTTGELLARAIQDVDMAGNHFAVKEYQPGSKSKWRIRRLRPDWVDIILTADPREAVKSDVMGYIYRPGNTDDKTKWELFPVDGSNGTIIHWSPIPDPEAQYRGMSWITPVIREVLADRAITKHKLKFFEQAAVPNLAISFPEGTSLEDFQEFKRIMDETKSGVDHAYENLYVGGGADVTAIGANIQQLDFRATTAIGEARIAAAARVHPSIVGLLEGLGGASMNEGNFQAAKESFVDGTLKPLWRSLCAAYAPLADVPAGKRLWYDTGEISFLREDREKVARRQQIDATSISRYVMQGFKPETAVQAILTDDLTVLEHTGLFSVQLLPPNISHPEDFPADEGGTEPDGTKPTPPEDGNGKSDSNSGTSQGNSKTSGTNTKGGKTQAPSKAANFPTGSKRKPVGRPPSKARDEWQEALERGDPWDEPEDGQGAHI